MMHTIIKRSLAMLIACSFLTEVSYAQNASPAPKADSNSAASSKDAALRFEVAMIRPADPKSDASFSINGMNSPHFTCKMVTVGTLISIAYRLKGADDIEGIPKSLDSKLWEVSTATANDLSPTGTQFSTMLLHLLEERFHLKAHMETAQTSGYELVLKKDASKLVKTDKPGTGMAYLFAGEIRAGIITMQGFADILAQPLGKPVQDATHLSGNYDMDVKFAPPNDPDSTLPSLPTALEELYGLKLQKATVTKNTLHIDHIDEAPTEE